MKTFLSFILIFMIGVRLTAAQENQTLQIGDQAPPLKYSKWLQGPKPITSIDKNKLYVIEFWATWCGPCIAAMPHLSELAKQYEGKIEFIGCDIWENNYGGPKDQESYLPKVSRFVQDQYKMGRLTYNVIMDNTAEDMGNKWLKAAGVKGIPSSFVIEKGKIVWIGHPHYLDSILIAVVGGTYDMQAEKTRLAQQARRNEQASAGYNAAIKAYKEAEAKKDYTQALRLVNEAIGKFPDNTYLFTTDKFMLLLDHYGEEKAIEYGWELQKEKLPGQVLIANLHIKKNLPQKVIEFGIAAVKQWKMDDNPKVWDILATWEARGGFFRDAAESQRKAVEVAKKLRDDPQWSGMLTDGLLNDYKEKAEKYQKKADEADTAPNAHDQKTTLHIGDKVPELKYGAWLKGSPIKEYEKGRLYIFEFWATWCGPCIASMPHLSEFAREHKENVTVIAVNIWEGSHGENDKPYDSFLPKVSRFVSNMKDKMDFNVIMDNNDQHMGNQWMKAAGQGGIPCSFMVKDGIIQWIGHPIELDSIVKVVSDKNYDVAAVRKAIEQKSEAADEKMAPFIAINKEYEKLVAEKKYREAIQLLDSGAALHEDFAGTFGFFKFQTMLEHMDEAKALAFAKEWQKTKPGYVGSTAGVIAQKKGLSKATYEFGLSLAKQLLDNPQMPPSIVYVMMASLYANMTDYKAAVETQEKAIKEGKQALKDGKYPGFIMEDNIKEWETVLAGYKKELK